MVFILKNDTIILVQEDRNDWRVGFQFSVFSFGTWDTKTVEHQSEMSVLPILYGWLQYILIIDSMYVCVPLSTRAVLFVLSVWYCWLVFERI